MAFDDALERSYGKDDLAVKAGYHHPLNRAARQQAREEEKMLKAIYEDGLREGKQSSRKKTDRKANAKKQVAKVIDPITTNVTSGADAGYRQAVAPIRSGVSSAISTLTLSLGVVALYLFLDSAPAVSGALGALNKGLSWLKDPTKSIPYRQ